MTCGRSETIPRVQYFRIQTAQSHVSRIDSQPVLLTGNVELPALSAHLFRPRLQAAMKCKKAVAKIELLT